MSNMKLKLFSERGQALILIAFGAIALFAIAGLAIDGTAKYADRRHAQNAADTAALAGALQLSKEKPGGGLGGTCPPAGIPSAACANVINAAKDRANNNGYTDDKVTSFVDVYIPPISGYYSGANCVG